MAGQAVCLSDASLSLGPETGNGQGVRLAGPALLGSMSVGVAAVHIRGSVINAHGE